MEWARRGWLHVSPTLSSWTVCRRRATVPVCGRAENRAVRSRPDVVLGHRASHDVIRRADLRHCVGDDRRSVRRARFDHAAPRDPSTFRHVTILGVGSGARHRMIGPGPVRRRDVLRVRRTDRSRLLVKAPPVDRCREHRPCRHRARTNPARTNPVRRDRRRDLLRLARSGVLRPNAGPRATRGTCRRDGLPTLRDPNRRGSRPVRCLERHCFHASRHPRHGVACPNPL